MKVLFIYSLFDTHSASKPLWSWSSIQFGISYISSTLKTHGHQTRLVVLGSNHPWRDNIKTLSAAMKEFSPELICVTAVASEYPFVQKIAAAIKNRWPDKYIILGGVHATLNPSEAIRGPFDAVCLGEGEYPLLELCRQIETNTAPNGIANLWLKSPDGNIEKNSPRPFLQDIDSLPFPDRALWAPWIKEQPGEEMAVLLGRGCPYDCTYCCNHALRKVAPGKYVRFRSPENIIQEVASLHAAYPARTKIYFEVESINADKSWLMEFCKQLEAFNATINNSISYGCNFRISPQSLDEAIFLTLKKANFYRINFGIEAGSERVRREILKRNYSNEDCLKTASRARKAGLKFCVFNMIGLPGETYEEHMETVSLNRQCQPDRHFTEIFFPYPGTKIYERCVREGYIKASIVNRMERRQPVIDYPHFSRAQIQEAYVWFHYRIYKGFRPLWWLWLGTLVTIVSSSTALNFLFLKITHWPGLNYVRQKLVRL